MALDVPDQNPDTVGHKTVFVSVECPLRDLTPEDLARPRYGRPNPARHLADDGPPSAAGEQANPA